VSGAPRSTALLVAIASVGIVALMGTGCGDGGNTEVTIPTISVGAGPHCDGQLLVWSDWAGMSRGRIPRFVKQYAQIGDTLLEAARTFREEVESGQYPAPEHEYSE